MVHVKQLSFLIMITGALGLMGCESTKQNMADKQIVSVPVGNSSQLSLAQVWPMPAHGSFLQKITATVKGQQHTFSVHLTMEDLKLEMIAFTEVYGRLYHLIWTPGKIYWNACTDLADALQPDNIIADFLLTHLPLEQLNASLVGAKARQEIEHRIVEDKSVILREIDRKQSLQYIWKKVVIHNPQLDYKLEIESVPLS